MFERFISNDICRKILFWLMNHSTGDYDAAIIAYDCGILDVQVFTSYIYIFNELGILSVDDSSDSDSLRVIFNEDSLIVQSFKNLRESFDDEAYRNSNVCAAFVSIESGALGGVESQMLRHFNTLTEQEREEFYNMLTDYKNFELNEDPLIAEAQRSLIKQIEELDEEGELDNFIEFIKRNLYI